VEPRERLKRYLEQRRELGERELVLDGMTVEDVMKIVGATGAGAQRTTPAAAPARTDPPAARRNEARGNADGPPAVADWREALKASGVDPAKSTEGRKTTPSRERPVREQTMPAADSPVGEGPQDAHVAAAEPPVSKRYEFPIPADASGSAEQVADATTPTATSSAASPKATAGATAPPAAPDAPPGIVVGVATRDLFGPADARPASLEEIAETTRKCTRCRLYATATNAVPGEGNANADLVCVGEAPGANEDASGRPFVGQAGQLLTKILAAINLGREDVFICNVLKHRPPGNRNPLPDEVAACSPYLVQQLEVIRPKVIVAFGTFAAQTLLNTKLPIGKLRGSVHRYYGIPLIVTYHPAALLRNPAWKRPTWEDVQLARRILDSSPRT
jgi:DNA polymerase